MKPESDSVFGATSEPLPPSAEEAKMFLRNYFATLDLIPIMRGFAVNPDVPAILPNYSNVTIGLQRSSEAKEIEIEGWKIELTLSEDTKSTVTKITYVSKQPISEEIIANLFTRLLQF